MTYEYMKPNPEQLDFWPDNLIQVNFKERYAYELSPPLTNSDRIIYEWIAASEQQRLLRQQRFQAWKTYLYAIRILTPQIRLKVYKKNDEIIVERILYRGYTLREQMKLHNMRVVK
ncbi:MAG: hypothetical protein MJA28_11950 [Gammaproteobacteria bacterium]|nr:hypothetical protein [Gammaproteobacteria bacterium]